MNLLALKYMVSLAREKHFGHAAQACGVSQPTLSIAVKNLEAQLGVQLFERHPMDVRPTPVGLAIVRHAMQVLQEIQAIEEVARASHSQDVGLLRVGAAHHVQAGWMTHCMQRCRAVAPQMPVLWHHDTRSKLNEQLKDGAIDFAILDCPTVEAGLKTALLLQEPLFVAVAAHHPLARLKKVELQALEQETLLLPGVGDNLLDPLTQTCPDLARWVSGPNCMVQKVKGASLESIAHMVLAGLGVAIMPRISSPNKDEEGLCYLSLKGIKLSRQLILAWRAQHHRESARALLMGVLQASMQEELTGMG